MEWMEKFHTGGIAQQGISNVDCGLDKATINLQFANMLLTIPDSWWNLLFFFLFFLIKKKINISDIVWYSHSLLNILVPFSDLKSKPILSIRNMLITSISFKSVIPFELSF